MTPFPRLRAGTMPSADDLNRVLEMAERSFRLTADAPLEAANDGTGWHVRFAGPPVVLAKVTGSTSSSGSPPAHSWTEQVILPSGIIQDKPGGLTGTTAYLPVFEANYRAIATGEVVLAFRGQGEYYETVWSPDCCGSGSGGQVMAVVTGLCLSTGSGSG